MLTGHEKLRRACEEVRDVDGGTNALVLAPAFADGEDDLCDCLLSGRDPAETDLLWVTFSDGADDRLAAWRRRHEELPANLGIVEVGGPGRDPEAPAGADVVAVSGPGDLTTTGVRLSGLVDDWADSGNRLVACFYGLTVPLQHVQLDRLYRFLHIVVRRLNEADAVAHYHLDPAVLDDRQLGTLLSLFDAVIEHEDGGWQLRRK